MNNVIEKIIEEQNSLSEKGILDSLTVNDNVNRLKSIEALLINNQGLAVIKNQISQLKVGDQYKKNLEQYVHDFHNPIQPESENVCEISDSNEVVNVTAKANETQAGNNEEENQPAPAPNQPPPQLTQFELGVALGALQKETVSLKEYIDNVVAKQKDLNRLVCDEKEMFININNNAGILSETMNRIEPLILKITPEISRAANETKETLVNALADEKLIKRVTEHQTEVEEWFKKITKTTNDDIVDLYKTVTKTSGTIVDEVIEKTKKNIAESGVEIIKTSAEISNKAIDKKYTNLIIWGLVGAFVCSMITSAFTAKLVATYSSNSTIDYIQRWVNAVAEKSNEHQQQKKSKK